MISSSTAHSALVTLELRIGDRRVRLAQAANNFAIAAEPVEFPPGNGILVMSIDGKVKQVPVYFPNGCAINDQKFRLEKPTSRLPIE